MDGLHLELRGDDAAFLGRGCDFDGGEEEAVYCACMDHAGP